MSFNRLWLQILQCVLVAIFLSQILTSGKSADEAIDDTHGRRQLDDDTAGFISIDCGSTGESQFYAGSNLFYTSDGKYIDTGSNMQVSSDYMKDRVPDLYRTVRSFPDGRRNCYTLGPLQGSNYLIRARFMYGNYDGVNSIPKFDVYIGVNFWMQVELSAADFRLFPELIYAPPTTTDYIYVCLVNIDQGAPFISALELRPLNNSIYKSQSGSLSRQSRYDVGGTKDDMSYILKEDKYDRIWTFLPQYGFQEWEFFSENVAINPANTGAYKIPSIVLSTAAKPVYANDSLVCSWNSTEPMAVVYMFWHFAEIEEVGLNDTREFQIYMSGNFSSGPISPRYLEAQMIASPATPLNGSTFWFSINKTSRSTLPPILNAVEFYTQISLPQSATNDEDVEAIMDVKRNYRVEKVWQGDPCLPAYPWDGLTCSGNDSYSSPRIISVDLSLSGLTGNIPPSLLNLTSLKFLNLSNNGLTGTIPEFLAELPSLKVIDLSRNRLTGSVPQALTAKLNNGLLTLSLGNNPNLCTLDPCEKKQNKKDREYKLLVPLVSLASLFLIVLMTVAVFCACKLKRRRELTVANNKAASMKFREQRFTYYEVINMTNHFQSMIGKGGFGMVYHGLLTDGTEVAVKLLNPSSTVSFKLFQTEAQLLMRVHHKHLVSLIGYCDEGTTMALIYEYMTNGNLEEHLSEKNVNVLSWKQRLQIAIDAAQGLEYLHSGCKPPIIHRDVKMANILLDEKMQAMIADFGVSRMFSTESQTHVSTGVVGTHGYLDPEYYISYRLNEKSDVYSFGIVLLELITGRPAIIKDTETIHIVNWVEPMLAAGDIQNIMDERLQRDFSTNSAWKTLETAMACVPPTAIQRPTMSLVVADLKDSLAIERAHAVNTRIENHGMASNQTLNTTGIELTPSVR